MFNGTAIFAHLGVLATCLLVSGGEWSRDFQADPVGEQPPGFQFAATRGKASGEWRVVEHEGGRVLAQLDERPLKWRFALAMVEDWSLKDVRLSVRIKAIRGELDQSGGLVWRHRDADNYLVARLDVSDQNVRLFRVFNGNTVPFGIKENVPLKRDQWYTLRVEHRGREVKVYLDDEVLIVEKDKHFREPGRIGLWTKADSVTYFDDLQAKNLGDEDAKAEADEPVESPTPAPDAVPPPQPQR